MIGRFFKKFAADVQTEIVGKPSETFFTSVLDDMGVSAENVSEVLVPRHFLTSALRY